MCELENGTKAAIAAGFSKNGAGQRASELLKDSKVRARLKQLRDERNKACMDGGKELIKKLHDIINLKPGDFVKIRPIEYEIEDKGQKKTIHAASIEAIVDKIHNSPYVSKIKLDKNGNLAIEFVSKETCYRLLKEIYYDIKEDDKPKEFKITFNDNLTLKQKSEE